MSSVIRVNKTKDFTIMSNYHFRDKNLSLKAKGLLSLMLSLPDEWDYSINGLVAICKENETAIKSTLNELKKYGYLVIDKLMPNETKSGRIEYIYNIYETPHLNTRGEKQEVEKQGVENLGVENRGQYNTNKSNTKELNTKDKKINDKLDKQKSSKNEPIEDNKVIEGSTKLTGGIRSNDIGIEKPKYYLQAENFITKHLIKIGFLKEDDIEIDRYDDLFDKSLDQYQDFNLIRDVVNYVVKRMKNNKDIKDNFKYFKQAFEENLKQQDRLRNTTFEERMTNQDPSFYNWLEE